MSIDLRAGAVEYLQARRARGYLSRDHAWLISSFLDGLVAQNLTTITRAGVLAFATAPIGTGRAWQAFRLSTIRGFAAYVHGLDPDVAEVIPEGLIPARYARRIPYLYSATQISDLMTRSAALLPPLLGVTMAAFIGLIAATGMRGGEAIALDSEDFLPAPALLTVTGKYGRQRLLPLHHHRRCADHLPTDPRHHDPRTRGRPVLRRRHRQTAQPQQRPRGVPTPRRRLRPAHQPRDQAPTTP